jgi:predicted nucleic acid-binding protein
MTRPWEQLIFLDTSAIYALADAADPNHERAKELFGKALEMGAEFLVHNYILVESAALLQSRLGLGPAIRFLKESENFRIYWVTARDHRRAVRLLEERSKRGLSFVDCLSFLVMREHKVRKALAFDPDFVQEGFELFQD